MLISGLTVLVAMAGMLFAGTKIFTSIGIGAMLVVFCSLVGSLTVLPALLGEVRPTTSSARPAPGARRDSPRRSLRPFKSTTAMARLAARDADCCCNASRATGRSRGCGAS